MDDDQPSWLDAYRDPGASQTPEPPTRTSASLGDPVAAHPDGKRFFRPLHFLPPTASAWPSMQEFHQAWERRTTHWVLWWREATPAELTAECRDLGVSAALSWLASHSKTLNDAYLVGCEIVYQPVPEGLLPPGEWTLGPDGWEPATPPGQPRAGT